MRLGPRSTLGEPTTLSADAPASAPVRGLNPSTILAAMSLRGSRDTHPTISSCPADEVLPSTPRIEVELLRDVSVSPEGFLQVREVELQNRYEDGTLSEPYRYFMVERARLDAVAIVLYRRSHDGIELVLRSQLRPPLSFREEHETPLPEAGTGAVQWEVPAGLVEPGERGHAGLHFRASAEALEEVGVVLSPERFRTLGAPTSLTPGVIAEQIHFVCAELLPSDTWQKADGDGHVLERRSLSYFVPLATALASLAQGIIHDVKTEVAIYRLQAHVAGLAPHSERSQA